MKIYVGAVLAVSLFQGIAGAQGTAARVPDPRRAAPAGLRARVMPLSAREAVNLSLNHNLDLEVARYQPWIENQNVTAALGTWDHVAYANASGGEAIRAGTSSILDVTRSETDTAGFDVGIRKVLPGGASYDVSFRSSRSLSNQPYLFVNPLWTQSFGAVVTLPLLKGASTIANTSALLVARHARDIALDQFERALADSVFQVMQAYWDLVFAIEDQKVKERSLEVAVRLLEDNRRKFERGLVARIDVTEADAGVAAQQEGILTAEAEVLNATDRLKRLIDPSLLGDEVAIAPVDAPRGLEAEMDERAAAEGALAMALERRPELRELRRKLESQEVSIVKSENDLLPRFDLSGRAFLLGQDDTFSGASKQGRDTNFHELAVGVTLEIPLEGSAARGALHRAELERRRLRLQERSLHDQVRVEVRQSVRAIKTNEKRIEATRRARVLAGDQLEAEETRRQQGLSTTFRVLDVQEDLVRSRTNELKALIDYNLSLHKLDQVTGTLLEKNGILLAENLQPRTAPGNER